MKKLKQLTENRVIVTIICSITAVSINYLISFLLAPYVTNTLGGEVYGFITLAKTVANYGIIITTCFNSFSARYITLAYHAKKKKESEQFYSTIIYINAALVLASIGFSLLFITWIDRIFIIPYELVDDIRVLFFCDIINYALFALANCNSVAAHIKNRLYLVSVIKIFAYLIEIVVLFTLFSVFTPKAYYVGVALLASTLVIGLCNILMMRKLTPELKFNRKAFTWDATRKLFLSGIWNSINSIGNLLNSGLDLWVSNLLLTAQSMGELSIVKTVTTIITSMFQLVSQPYQPELLKHYANNDINKVVCTLKKQIRLNGFVSCLAVIGFVALGEFYYMLWVPNQNDLLLNSLTMLSMVGLFFEGIVQPLFYVYTLTIKNRIPCIVTIISGILNVIGMYVLIVYYEMDLYAVVGTTAVLGIITFFIFTPLYSAKCLKLNRLTFYPCIIKVCFACAIGLTVTKAFIGNIVVDTWFRLISMAILIVIIMIPIYTLCTCNPKKVIGMIVQKN